MSNFDLSAYFGVLANEKQTQRRVAVEAALTLVRAGILAEKQGAFWEYHEGLKVKSEKLEAVIKMDKITGDNQLLKAEPLELINPIKRCADMIQEALKVKDE